MVQTEEGQKLEIFRLRDVKKSLVYHQHMAQIMDRWPIDAVWDFALEYLETTSPSFDNQGAPSAEWTENKILLLIESGDNNYWPRLLSWYLSKPHHYRPCEFAISLLSKIKAYRERWEKEIIKMVCSHFKRQGSYDGASYWNTESKPSLFKEVLYRFTSPTHGKAYYQDEWSSVRRIIRCIVEQRDYTWISFIEEIQRKLQTGILIPGDLDTPFGFGKKDPFVLEEHKSFIQTAIAILRQEQVDQTPDLNWTWGSELVKEMDQYGSVQVSINLVDFYEVDLEPEGEIDISLKFTPEVEAQEDRLKEVLKNYELVVWGEGVYVRNANYDHQIPFEGLGCTIRFSVRTSGPKRYRIRLVKKGDSSFELPQAYFYFTVN